MDGIYTLASRALKTLYNRHVDTPPVLEADYFFPGHTEFLRNFPEIREECVRLMGEIESVPRFHEVMREQESLSTHGDKYWRMYILKAYGLDHEANQARCPAVSALIRQNPTIKSAAISFLEGKKHIPGHHGPFRGIIRYTLPLVIPLRPGGESTNRLRIADRVYELREGQDLLWDDTCYHEAWNDADTPRAALLIDVIRPGLPGHLRAVTLIIMSLVQFFIRLRGQKSWELAQKLF